MYFFLKLIWLKKYFSAIYKIKQGFPLDYPEVVYIDITNGCNLRCIMCPQSKGLKREKMTMGLNDFAKIIDQISISRPRVFLHLSGEPLLNKNLYEIIKYATDKGCSVGMHSNATLLSEEMSIQILKSPLNNICFSFDGCSKEIYERLRIGANFEKVKLQIETFLKLKLAMGAKKPYTYVEIIRMRETQGHIPDFIRYWRHRGVDRVKVRECVTWLGLTDDHRVKIPRNFGHFSCTEIFNKCSILADGTIVPCCMDVEGRLPLGNILETNFDEIWNGELYNRLRTHHINNTVPENIICYGCHLRWVKTSRDFIRWWISLRILKTQK